MLVSISFNPSSSISFNYRQRACRDIPLLHPLYTPSRIPAAAELNTFRLASNKQQLDHIIDVNHPPGRSPIKPDIVAPYHLCPIPLFLLLPSLFFVMLSYDNPIIISGNSTTSASIAAVDMATNGSRIPGRVQAPQSVGAPALGNGSADATLASQTGKPTKSHHIFLVTGPAGVGKSSVAAYLSQSLGFPYIEGDEFHPLSNVEKMSNGIPLTDADRWDWLTALREESLRQIRAGSEGVVLTCSALKQKYRDVIRVAGYFDHSLLIHFIYLSAPEELLLERVSLRQNHYMGANMVQSQFDILEPPGPNENDVISIDVTRTLAEVQVDALAKARAIMATTD